MIRLFYYFGYLEFDSKFQNIAIRPIAFYLQRPISGFKVRSYKIKPKFHPWVWVIHMVKQN